MAREFDTDILIVGAGSAGLSMAIDLARRGVAFQIIDKVEDVFRGSRGKGIQPRTLEIFEDLGVVDRIMAQGGEYPPQRDYDDDGSYTDSLVMDQREPTSSEPYPVTIMLPQFMTEAVLRDRLAELGAAARFGTELTGFSADDNGVTAQLSTPDGEESLRVRYLVGADGGRSFVRQALGVEFPGKSLGARAVVADVTIDGLSRDFWHRWKSKAPERMSIVHLRGTEMFQIQAAIPLEGDFDTSAEGLTAMLAERTGRGDLRVISVSWASTYNLSARLADKYRAGRIFMAGDSVHAHPPTGAQGLNTSVQDAYNLSWKLALAVEQGVDLLDTYEDERRPIAAGMLGLSTGLLSDTQKGELRRGRDVQQLDLRYRESPLGFDQNPEGKGIRAGDRAADASCRTAGKRRSCLFSHFKGPHWTLLGYEPGANVTVAPRKGLHIHLIGPDKEIVDDQNDIQTTYGLERGDWLLVRPDGYVGARVGNDDVEALKTYFRKIGL